MPNKDSLYAILAKPNAKKNKIESTGEKALKIWVTASPHENAANEKIIKMLAQYFHTAPSNIEIVRGHNGKNKIITVTR
ncbi:MAG: DUF167 domain-containing protein [Candidatus Niyogibacteria bacterium]|nr:DUF167 domain-containing protein [Candidatus Niyogibacteria bacterium]